MTMNIPKGTVVRIKTTNGGDVTAQLLQTYRPTYDAVIANGTPEPNKFTPYVIIPAWRIKSIEPKGV